MREWIDDLAGWMQNREEITPELIEEFYQLTMKTDSLLEASEQLETAYSSLLGKHGDS